MDKNAVWKWLFLVLAVAGSLALVVPIQDKVKLGLDLRGGTSFVLQVDTSELDKDARKNVIDRALEIIRTRVDSMGVSEPIIFPEPKSERIVVQIPGLKAEQRDRAVEALKRQAYLAFRMVHEKNEELVNGLFQEELAPQGYKIVTMSLPTTDGGSVTRSYYKKDTEALPKTDLNEKASEVLARFHTPPGYEFMFMERQVNNQTVYEPYYVNRRPELSGEYITKAFVDYQQLGQPIVNMRFDAKGSKKFAVTTRDYSPGGPKNPEQDKQRYLAIVLDGKLFSAPFIRQAIYGGQAVIEGGFTQQEARDLAVVLEAGSLPTPVEIVEERGVDPSLGKDSINSGARAAIYGGIAVLVFMMLYYMLAGVVANLALLLDMLLLPLGMIVASGFLGLFTGSQTGGAIELPTLTLPGIAGIVLTIGMAVDANVLIFERIREEFRAGKKLGAAVDAGYDKAFSTILDANITTLITALILFWKGSGPIRGFAVTLSAGIIVSMYTVLVVTRMLFHLIENKTSIEKIKMLRLVGDVNFNFVGKRLLAAILSVVLIIGSWSMFFQKGEDNFGVDFTGGTSLTFNFEEQVDVASVREVLTDSGIAESFIQYQSVRDAVDPTMTKQYLNIKVGFGDGDKTKEVILTSFADQGYRDIQTETVGPQVGKELKRKGLMAILFAMIGIVIYITIRFEFAFAAGAIAALLHDVLITIGVFCLFGRQLSLPIIAALLTIVGYSVNDTIVVFDRIREDLKLMKGKPYKEICNTSINQTLSRTLLTSVTTLLSVVMLLIFGGGAINDFAFALFIGILVGTYSSIFVATPVVLLFHKERPAKEQKA